MPPRFQEPYRSAGCPVEAALGLIGGKWKGIALYHLMGGTLRFNEIRRRIPGVTQRMLTTQLRELEADGLIVRVVYPEVPPRVEYSLFAKGRTLEPVIMGLKIWGEAHARTPQAASADKAA
ncbi:winged helix-turn-helix transcriptional regulator [Bosea sp. NBC_00550]|uniref:winged helix-turn-helix transcriptional regulator n=1 Tax=Bosea sp. NBC_00550 TaxID=2969621 RepID=UPI00222E087C|nr:helix-turn-helix domain-containing protein [Bosea sp. NBC_00550]UZF92413.1 helix-turn-helix transcriptional regulator [Bosea sp. NBC_00550]